MVTEPRSTFLGRFCDILDSIDPKSSSGVTERRNWPTLLRKRRIIIVADNFYRPPIVCKLN